MSYKPDVWPSDLGFFPDNKKEFIKQSTAQQLRDYISMHWKTFANSKRQWKKRSINRVQSITVWLWGIGSNKLRIQHTKQWHQEQVMNALLTRTRQKQQKRKKKDEPEMGQTQIWGFLSQRRTQTKQPTVIRQCCNPLVHNSWNNKNKHKNIENKRNNKRTNGSRQLPMTGFLSLHNCIWRAKKKEKKKNIYIYIYIYI